MKIKNIFLLLSMVPCISLAKVELLTSGITATLISENKNLSMLFQPVIQSNELEVVEKYMNKEASFALVREDIFYTFLSEHKMLHSNYHIIGKISEKAILYFFSKEDHKIKNIQNKKISIGRLGDKTNLYLKQILKKQHIPYTVNMQSEDFYHALQALRDDEIDAIFMFGRENYKHKFIHYIQDYPKGFLEGLKEEKGLVCEKNSCYTSYYFIASDSVGEQVMHNIYVQVTPILAKNKALTSYLGKYYIDIKQGKPTLVEKNTSFILHDVYSKSPTFGRAPWMDIAIQEAIIGKGSAENVFPMLDLSYKYIRFSKGNKGITTAPNDSKFGSWCAAYICWTLDKSGFQVHQKGRMASQSFRYFKDTLYKKINHAIFGAITVYTSNKNPQHGHVGYLYGRTIKGDNILLGGNQNNRLKFSAYPARGFGSYRFNGFYIPKNYVIQDKDKLTYKDLYSSVKSLNKEYGIQSSNQSKKVR